MKPVKKVENELAKKQLQQQEQPAHKCSSSIPMFQQLLDNRCIRSESSGEDEYESPSEDVQHLADGTMVDHSSVIHHGMQEEDGEIDEDAIEGLELLSSVRESDRSVLFVVHRDAEASLAAVSMKSASSSSSSATTSPIEICRLECDEAGRGWSKEEIPFLERTTFYRLL